MKNAKLPHLVFLIAYVIAEENTRVVYEYSSIGNPNSYYFRYDLSDDTKRSEHGNFYESQDNGNGILRVDGFYEYTSPEGIHHAVYYVADEYGFRLVQPPSPPLPQLGGSFGGISFASGSPSISSRRPPGIIRLSPTNFNKIANAPKSNNKARFDLL